MRKFGFFAVTAVILAGSGVWIAATTQARVTAPTKSAQIDVLQMMSVAGDLPSGRFVDYSLVYEN